MPGILDIINGLTGGLLGGGQAPPQQQRGPAPQGPAALPGYGAVENNPLMAGLSNLGGGGSPMGAIANAITGFTTGQRTDPVGAYQQRANLAYRIMRQLPGVTDQQAQLGALDPNMQKEIIQRQFPEYEFKEINGTLVATEKHTGRIVWNQAFTPPKEGTLSPGQVPYQWPGQVGGQPVPQGGGVPGPQSPITTSPLATIPGTSGPMPLGGGTQESVGGTGAPPNPPSATATAAPSTTSASSGRGLPPGGKLPGATAPGVILPLGPPMTVKEEASQREAGRIAGGAGQTLSPTVKDLQSTIDLIDKVKAHVGKAAAVGRFQGAFPAVAGAASDFAKLLDQLQTQAAPQLDSKANEKTKESITGLSRRQDPTQFDAQLDALRQTLVDKQQAARDVAGTGTPSAPEAPKITPPPAGSGAAGASGAGQGAPQLPTLVPGKTIYQGHLYLGGNPNNKTSWQAAP